MFAIPPKENGGYAAFFPLGRLQNMGLRVDLLFPNPEIPLAKVLGNIAMRGVMFAICVSPENEVHRKNNHHF